MKNPFRNQKTNWKYILIVVILALFVGGGILGYTRIFTKKIVSPYQAPEIKKPEKIVEDETADWKTYRNEEYGFEVKYPLEEMLYKEISEINFYKDPTYKGIKIGELNHGCSPNIYPHIDDKFLSLLEEFREESGEPMYPLSEVIERDGKKWYFGFSIASHAVDIESCQPIFNQMLSTFRFLE